MRWRGKQLDENSEGQATLEGNNSAVGLRPTATGSNGVLLVPKIEEVGLKTI